MYIFAKNLFMFSNYYDQKCIFIPDSVIGVLKLIIRQNFLYLDCLKLPNE